MSKRLSLLLFLGYCTLLQDVFLKPVTAEVTRDGTTNTTVDVSGNNFTIQEGERAGGNLFHSFGEFSVPTDGSAFFNNAADIVNIFSRVTGGNISNIDGLLRANGNANLFLLNPAGIVFGENARLAIGGSFFGTTADSFLFEDGEFSATDLDNPPLLTINVPIGLGLGDNPGNIVNRSNFGFTDQTFDQVRDSETIQTTSVTNITGLEVDQGQSLALIGGNIFLEGSGTTAPGGKVELGGLSLAGEIGINPDGSLSFPDGITRADVTLTGGALVNVTAGGGGFINVNARNLTLSEQSQIRAGIAENMGSPEAQAGDITIDATESIRIVGIEQPAGGPGWNTEIDNHVGINPNKTDNSDDKSTAQGNAGDIFINTNSLEISSKGTIRFRNKGKISSVSFSEGNSGDVVVNANNILLDPGDISSEVQSEKGNAGNVEINVNDSLSVMNESVIQAKQINNVEGNAGDITINTGSFSLKGKTFVLTDKRGGRGNAGDITIHASDSIVLEGTEEGSSQLSTQIADNAVGNAGTIKINTNILSITQGNIFADTAGQGDAGDIIIEATDVSIDQNSKILTQVQDTANGKGGKIQINADNIFLTETSFVSTKTDAEATGDAGDIILNADTIRITKGSSFDSFTDGNSNGGNITITTRILEIFSGGEVTTSTFAQGNAGDITVNASESVILSGVAEADDENPNRSGLSANALVGSGNGGNINIVTDRLIINDGGTIEAGNFEGLDRLKPGTGKPGDIYVEANSLSLTNEARISAATQSETGNTANINLQLTEDLTLKDNSFISARALEDADGGNLNINARFILGFPSQGNGNDLIAKAEEGDGGKIDINAQQIFNLQEGRAINDNGEFIPNNRNDIDASSDSGLDGTVEISEPDVNLAQEERLSTEVVDLERLIAQNLCQRGDESEFIITGKGGMAPSPSEPRDGEISEVDLVEPAPFVEDGEEEEQSKSPLESQQASEDNPLPVEEIVQAQGWIINEQGKVRLVAYKTDPNSSPTRAKEPPVCHQ